MVFERSKSGGMSEEKMRREGGSVCRAIERIGLRKRYIDAGNVGEEGIEWCSLFVWVRVSVMINKGERASDCSLFISTSF
jgi:hypothetical protein